MILALPLDPKNDPQHRYPNDAPRMACEWFKGTAPCGQPVTHATPLDVVRLCADCAALFNEPRPSFTPQEAALGLHDSG